MSYVSALWALFKTWQEDPSSQSWLDVYLDYLVQAEHFFFQGFLYLWFVLLVFVVITVVFARRRGGGEIGIGCGCALAFLGLYPVFEYITYQLALQMASAVGPEGITNMSKLVISGIVFLLLGSG